VDFDVVVIGAGPAGSSAAQEIAQGGWCVGLLERGAYPGQRAACGGGIEGADLELLGLPDSLIQRRITRREHYFPWGNTVIADPHVITLRQELDRWLAEQAVVAGATLFIRTRVRAVKRLAAGLVEVTADDHAAQQAVTYTARLAIFADGPHTLASHAGKLGFTCAPATAALGLFYELAWPDTPMAHHEIHFDPAISPWGYLWIFPARDLLNVGLTALPSKDAHRTQTIEARLQAFIDSRPDLRGRPILRRAGGHIPVVPAARFYDNNLLVVGDAAGMVDALTDAGIANGVCGGRLAGQTACEALAAGDYSAAFLARYQTRWQASPRGKMVRFQSRLTRALLPVNRLDPYLYAKVMQILFLGRDLRRWQKLRLLVYPLIRSALTPGAQR
jgi:digeranylgeranylglycerophospholipid reductase